MPEVECFILLCSTACVYLCNTPGQSWWSLPWGQKDHLHPIDFMGFSVCHYSRCRDFTPSTPVGFGSTVDGMTEANKNRQAGHREYHRRMPYKPIRMPWERFPL
jgi:hypothetical protein